MAEGAIKVSSVLKRSSSDPIIIQFGSGIGDSDGQAAIVRQGDRSLVLTKQRGRFYSGLTEKDSKSLCNNYLAVQTPESKVVLVPVGSCNVCAVDKAIEAKKDENTADRSTAVRTLAANFGSKRLKRAVNLREKMTNDATAKSEHVEDAVKGLEVKEEDLNYMVNLEANINEILPPCDREAASPVLVYPLDNLISPIERTSLEPTAKFMIEHPPTTVDNKVSFFMAHHYNLIGKKNITLEKMVLMIYIDSLFNFVTSKRKISPKDQFCSFSKMINDKIIGEFTEKRTRTTQLEDRAVCYTLILILHLCDMQIHLSPVSACFKGYTVDRLKILMRCIGVKPSLKKDVYSLSLPLPPLPKPSGKRKKKR